MAEPIQMPFRVVIHEGQRNHVLDGCPDALGEVANLEVAAC